MSDFFDRVKLSADLELERMLTESAGRPLTPDEMFEQKVSFVYGQLMNIQSDITKDEVREHLEALR